MGDVMNKSHYGWKIKKGAYYCLRCPLPETSLETVYVGEAHKRCCVCHKTLREVVEEEDSKDDFTP
jgi:hypothetical protein